MDDTEDRIEALEGAVKYLTEQMTTWRRLSEDLRTQVMSPKPSGLGSSHLDSSGTVRVHGSDGIAPANRMIYAHCGFANG